MIAHDPNIPSLGPDRRKAMRNVNVGLVVPCMDSTADASYRRKSRHKFGYCAGLPFQTRASCQPYRQPEWLLQCVTRSALINLAVLWANVNDLGGERFTDPEDRKRLLSILVDTEEHIAWPFLRFQELLKQQWGWPHA